MLALCQHNCSQKDVIRADPSLDSASFRGQLGQLKDVTEAVLGLR
jgi:hypothetical protein